MRQIVKNYGALQKCNYVFWGRIHERVRPGNELVQFGGKMLRTIMGLITKKERDMVWTFVQRQPCFLFVCEAAGSNLWGHFVFPVLAP